MVDHGESRQQAAPQTPAKNKQSRGPRSLWIDRWENGFGFTLRHFIVYPPESYSVMAGESRLGIRHSHSNPTEPMDTIFVKNVHEGTSAQAAGLATGDRILSVNGETIAGKSYAKVVQQIQNTPGRLHLLVVPKEDDIIQQYFSDTAHNPKTNPRPRLKSPETTGEHRRSSTVPTPSSQRIVTPQKLAKTSIKQPVGVLQQRVPFMDSGPIYDQLMWPENQKIGSENRGTMERHRLKTPLSRRLSDGSSSASSNSLQQQQESTLSVIKPVTTTTPPVYYPNSSGCRLSLDGGMLDRRESSSSSTLTDDSVIISRIRRSCEQKEEFLRNTVVPTYSPIIAREFYARPQKLQKPVWPPQSPETTDPSEQRPKSTPNDDRQTLSLGGGKPFPRTLTRIQENLPHNFGSSSLDSDTDEVPQSSHESLVSRSHSEESESVRRGVTQPKLHLVSRRAKQFESGQLEEEDRTHFYRSELARLSGKKVVPNVADRKQEFEQRVGREDRHSLNRETRSLETCSPPPLGNSLSGNRTVIVGSKHLHCEPPSDFKQLSPEIPEEPTFKTRARSNSAESWSSRDNDHTTRRSLHGVSVDRAKDEEKQRHKAVRQDSYLAAVKTIPGNVPVQTVPITTTADVVRRQRNATSLSVEDERATRRVSYLKATSNDHMNADTDGDSSASTQKSGESPPRRHVIDNLRPESKENFKLIKDGWLNCKVALIDGKRAGDRSWKQIWAILRGPFFSMQKDKNSEQSEQTVDVRSCNVDVPQDYTKKKNVLRLKTETETEYLLQAEDTGDMEQWKKVLEEQSEAGNTLSPQPTHKDIKKLSTLRTRSPTGQSPASKTRKPSQDQIPSPKSKTWKNKLGKQFRRMQGSGPPSSPTTPYPEGATIGVPIESCPPSTISDLIPLIVERCTSIVEARGLEIVGIYRVPGNTAAVTALTEAVNKGVELIHPEDPRWNDVNVISSLLKSFFRNLPDSLFTSELYPKFIASDKISDQKLRMIALRKLINELPDHNYETLKHLLYHLKKVVSNSAVNKMETRNLAIVFGPTLLTTGDLITLVTDTSHQCRIVESLISHVDWFFSNDDVDALDSMSLPMATEHQNSENQGNASLLLGNIHKVEGYSRGDHSPSKDISPKDIVSSILSAANRKMSKGKSKKPDKPAVNYEVETKSTVKKETKQGIEQTTSIASSKVNSFASEIVRTNGDDTDSSTNNLSHDEVIRSYSGLNEQTLERIRRFKQETEAMLQRDPVRTRRDAEKWLLEKQSIEMKLQQAKRELENEDLLDALADNPRDLTKKANMSQISSQSEDGNAVRRGTSYESLNNETITPNGSLKRFKSSREDSGLRTATSLDSLQDRPKSELSDDGNDLVVSLTRTFDKKLKSFLNESSSSSLGDENKSATEKADIENVVEKESKLLQKDEKKIAAEEENNNNNNNNINSNDEKAKSEESKKSKVKIDPKIKEKLKKFEISDTILRTKNSENVTNLKRSESLNKPEKPEVSMKLRRSESLNKNERSNDFSKLKRSDSSKNDLKRSDSLTKNEKTETNINKRKQEAGLKRSSSKEKENMLVKLKRKNGMPDRSIKRRHTVGGTKDFDKLPWLDNRLQTEAQENEESIKGKEKRNLRTSSPDLSSSRLKSAIESEGLSIEVSLLGSRGNVLATLRQHLIAPSPPGRPQSMPPVSQLFKLPLESHV